MFRLPDVAQFACVFILAGVCAAPAQLVILPAPRLLTTMPMGAQAGTSTEVTVTSESAEDPSELFFSDPKIIATPLKNAAGVAQKNKYTVTVAPDVAPGLYEARLMTRLGVSSARCFSIGNLKEVVREQPNNSVEKALLLQPGTVCNAFATPKAADFYRFQAEKGTRYVIQCAAQGIDSKLVPVLALADPQGKDMKVVRHGGILDFVASADGPQFIKVHSLTFQGGADSFYRLCLSSVPQGTSFERHASTRSVGAASLPKVHPSLTPWKDENEPNNTGVQAQKITLPCVIRGSFATAGDVDTFEFEAKKGEIWGLEVLSQRLGLPTDPFVLVQRVVKWDSAEELVDVAEFNDIPSPVKLSSYGYAYDGSPYDTGSLDPMGKIEIKEDGIYRIQIRDLYGGTRTAPENIYQLVLRKPAPDFSLVTWALHMELRNGDRANLSKPIALRNGATMAFEVVAIRKDGFDGVIELEMQNLPSGVSASSLRIPAGKNQGVLLITASEKAPRGMALARIVGKAKINGMDVTRECPTASMAWPVRDHSSEIPAPRLFADIPVSVGGSEDSPLSIAAEPDQVWEALAGTKLSIPLKLVWRGEFSGGPVKLKPLGAELNGIAPFDVPSKSPKAEVHLDLAQLKTPPGEYVFALHGGVVSKYRYNPGAVKVAEEAQKAAEQKFNEASEELRKLKSSTAQSASEKTTGSEDALKAATEKVQLAEALKADAAKNAKLAADAAAPKDIVDIVVSEPIRIRIKPPESK